MPGYYALCGTRVSMSWVLSRVGSSAVDSCCGPVKREMTIHLSIVFMEQLLPLSRGHGTRPIRRVFPFSSLGFICSSVWRPGGHDDSLGGGQHHRVEGLFWNERYDTQLYLLSKRLLAFSLLPLATEDRTLCLARFKDL